MKFEKVRALTGYAAHVESGVMLKTVTDGSTETIYARGNDIQEWFEAKVDSHGNICDADGIVIYPSRSGRHPSKRGDRGYFGKFAENFGRREDHPELPSVHDDVYSGR